MSLIIRSNSTTNNKSITVSDSIIRYFYSIIDKPIKSIRDRSKGINLNGFKLDNKKLTSNFYELKFISNQNEIIITGVFHFNNNYIECNNPLKLRQKPTLEQLTQKTQKDQAFERLLESLLLSGRPMLGYCPEGSISNVI